MEGESDLSCTSYRCRCFYMLFMFLGIYMFSANIMNILDQSWMLAYIMKESSILLSVHSDGSEYSTGSATVFSTCQEGERVYVRTADSVNLGMWGDATNRWSSFAGFLMALA